jgi:hypothetical protein
MAAVSRVPVARRLLKMPQTADSCLSWPPTGIQQARKPAGGFIDCPVDCLTLPWWRYQQGALALNTLRVWLGALELVEKRCDMAPETPVHYGPEELRRLLDLPRLTPVTTALQQLEALGLLAWSPQAIQFLPHVEVLREALAQDSYRRLRAQLAPGLRWVPVPRRLLRWLAQPGQPGLIATACGVLLRCMRYKARQCVAGGRVAATWVAAVLGVAERTVQRAFTTLERCGWLARLALQPERERPHGRYTVINLAWQRPGATETPRHAPPAAVSPQEPAGASCQNLSPLERVPCHNMSPLEVQTVSRSDENRETCGTSLASSFLQPFQEEGSDPEPPGRGPAGGMPQEEQEEKQLSATPASSADTEVTEEEYAAAQARLVAQGTDPAFLIRPAVLAEVQRARQEVAYSPMAAEQTTEGPTVPEATAATAVPRRAPTPRPPAPYAPWVPHTPVPACSHTPIRLPPPTLRDVILDDLSDVARLLALHQQAIARGWLQGGEAAQLNVVSAAVHARRVGDAPCRLFVVLLRDQRWEVITQEDEDQARALLRVSRDGPPRRCVPEACTPEPEAVRSADARFVLRAAQVLRQAGWQGEPFLGVKLVDPTWTRERWDRAQAALMQWQQRQGRTRWQGSGLEALGAAPDEEQRTNKQD